MTDFETIDRAIERIKRERDQLLRPTPQESPADIEQRVFLEMHAQCQESSEKSFCLGVVVGGALALSVLALTLWLVGVL